VLLTSGAAKILPESENLATLCLECNFLDILQVVECKAFSFGHFLLKTARFWPL